MYWIRYRDGSGPTRKYHYPPHQPRCSTQTIDVIINPRSRRTVWWSSSDLSATPDRANGCGRTTDHISPPMGRSGNSYAPKNIEPASRIARKGRLASRRTRSRILPTSALGTTMALPYSPTTVALTADQTIQFEADYYDTTSTAVGIGSSFSSELQNTAAGTGLRFAMFNLLDASFDQQSARKSKRSWRKRVSIRNASSASATTTGVPIRAASSRWHGIRAQVNLKALTPRRVSPQAYRERIAQTEKTVQLYPFSRIHPQGKVWVIKA